MLKSRYIEDIFTAFVDLCDNRKVTLTGQDWSAVQSFSHTILANNQLTKNQANFIIKILQKYRMFAKNAGLDYSTEITNPLWKNSFRVLDLSKKISVEQDSDGTLWLVLKFPFALKEVLEKEISPIVKDYSHSVWDAENKVRKMKFYNFNTIEIYEFVKKHNFEIDESFMSAMAEVEEFWGNFDEISPYSDIVDNQVELFGASEHTKEFYNSHKTEKILDNLMLAKSMGYFLKKKPENLVEKIAHEAHTQFHLKSINDFFEIYKSISGIVTVIVNKGEDAEPWVKNFCEISKNFGISNEELRICYRLDKHEDRGFNQWVKDNGYGGKVEGARILIFQNKPPKWLFSDEINVKIVLTNSLYPVPSAITQSWMDTHSCVCFVGNVKASGYKDRKIVEL